MADRNGYIGRAPSDSSVTVARQTFTPTGVTTTFTFTSGYTPGYFDIYLNGIRMIEGSDFTSTDGSTFSILDGGATNGDVIEGVAYKAFNAATATVGISSAGTPISTQANTLNFIGAGNTFALRGSTVDISIAGGGGGGGFFTRNATGITTLGNVGIGTTTANGGADSNNETILNAGIVTAVQYYGSGANLTALNATNIASGTIDSARVPTLNQDTSGNADTATLATNAQGLTGTPSINVASINATGISTFAGSVSIGGTLTYDDVTNVDSIGVITARAGVQVGSGQSFGANGPTAVYYGDGSNLTNLPAAGLSTEASSPTNAVVTLDLSAQDHKLNVTGITTITCSGGTEGDSHTVRIINAGVSTVGFSTYFLFASGATPDLPTASGAISLLSFTVNSVGAGGTQLLTGASLNYS
jgi:hypothetical protein